MEFESAVVLVFIVLFVLPVYFIPTMVACERKHKNSTAIVVLNLLFGWTILGWGIALVWALTNQERSNECSETQK